MELLLEAKDYSTDLRWLYILLLVILTFVIGSVGIFSLLVSEMSLSEIAIGCGGSIVVILMLISFIYYSGGFSSNPFKLYQNGVAVEGFSKSTFLQFNEIKSIEFYYFGFRPVNRGTEIITMSGKNFRNVWNYTSKEKLISFVEKARPILEEQGFRLEKKEGKRYLTVIFVR